ncbi:MAG: response regulator transcription factor [Pseudomonadota bacterium]
MKKRDEITVMLVDDHPVVRDGYRRLLEGAPDVRVVAELDSGEAACQKYTSVQPDVVVLDLNMPGMGGLEALRRIRAKDPEARILVFSMHDSQTMVKRAVEAGAAGFLTKSSAASQMLEAVRQVAQGLSFLNHHLVPNLFNPRSASGDPVQQLSKREFQIFRDLAAGKSVQEIADILSISPKTVGVHQTNIMKKLKLRNAAELTRLAIRSGVIEA